MSTVISKSFVPNQSVCQKAIEVEDDNWRTGLLSTKSQVPGVS